MANEEEKEVLTIEVIEKKDSKVKQVVLSHKEFAKTGEVLGERLFPRDHAVRLLKKQKLQKGYREAYKIVKFIR